MSQRERLRRAQRWVVKIGSALITHPGTGLDRVGMSGWTDQLSALRKGGRQTTLVSSGAVAEGMQRLGWRERPHEVYRLQAAAALGQMGLVAAWAEGLTRHDLHTAQILLTHDDLSDRRRYLNARSTLRELLRLGVVPVVNENDTVVTDEIRFGDNDTLAALVANLVEAEILVILTDQPGLMAEDPRKNPDAPLIDQVEAGDRSLEALCGSGPGNLGRGGMLTKVRAAERAARSGTYTVVASGREPNVLGRLARGEPGLGTLFIPDKEPLVARKQWLASHLRPAGRLVLDEGAARALRESGKSLLPVGVSRVEGDFQRGDMVACVDAEGREIARGLINYPAEETARILGQPSRSIETLLGYVEEMELIHRDNMVLTAH